MHVRSLGSNQTQVTVGNDTRIFFSYETPVAAYIPGRGYIKTRRFHSRTTSKHINQWLDGAPAEVVDQEELNEWVAAENS